MSGKLMSKVFDLKLTRPKREILLAMADHAPVNGTRVFPSVRLLAWKTDYSERQVRRIIGKLKADGLLIPIAHAKGGRNPDTGKGYSTTYEINLAAGIPKESFRKSQRPEDGFSVVHNPDIFDGKADILNSYPDTLECPPNRHIEIGNKESESLGVGVSRNADTRNGSIYTKEIQNRYIEAFEFNGGRIRNMIGFEIAVERGDFDEKINRWLEFGDEIFHQSSKFLDEYTRNKRDSQEIDGFIN